MRRAPIIAPLRAAAGQLAMLLLTSLLLASLLLASACTSGAAEPHVLQVYAASSLTAAFTEIEQAFEAAHDGVDAALAFAGSQVLRLQIEQGAPADVFASATHDHTQALIDARLLRGARPFAANELAVIVPLDNPAGIESYDGLTAAERLVIGTETVPVGRYARAALRRAAAALGTDFEAAVLSRVVSQENNARLVRAKVELGEADAAIVYRTDAAASTGVRTIPIPTGLNVQAEYVIGIVTGGDSRAPAGSGAGWAERWVSFVLSPEGRTILDRHGFLTP